MDGGKFQGMLCPMCFGIIKTATTLRCGHYFCSDCLEVQKDVEHVCPICREENLTSDSTSAGQVDSSHEEKPKDGESTIDAKQAGDLLDLGNLDLEGKATESNDHQNVTASADDDGKKTGDQLKACNTESAVAGENAPKVVTVVQIPRRACNVNGMAAQTKDAVVVGYGWDGKGSDCFSASGDKTQHLKSAVGNVCDVTFLTDGRSVASLGDNTGRVYDSDGTETDTKYSFIQGLGHPCLCSDQQDNIYVVNGNPAIYIFHGSNKAPHTTVPTGKILPLQVCVTRTGVMITSTCNFTRGRINVYDKTGNAGTSIAASGDDKDEDNEDGECLYAAVDSQDRVLIARVKRWSTALSLTRYTVEGATLTEDVAFEDVAVPRPIDMACWCYMVFLTPNMLAFANDCVVYFIKLPV